MSDLKWDERGLVTAVVQDSASGEVLMVAWMNAEALAQTRATGEAWFWSSRGAITKGRHERQRGAWTDPRDCDADTLLLRFNRRASLPTGERTCFYRPLEALS
jgi:phosphoribosyl-AMP cyclohydrolase